MVIFSSLRAAEREGFTWWDFNKELNHFLVRGEVKPGLFGIALAKPTKDGVNDTMDDDKVEINLADELEQLARRLERRLVDEYSEPKGASEYIIGFASGHKNGAEECIREIKSLIEEYKA